MPNQPLSTYFTLHRRYFRSVNLERDLDRADTVRGYVPTERSTEAVRRILGALANPKAHRSWTMTGVYGTGKSAFAHYLLALCAPEDSGMRRDALAIAHQAFPPHSPERLAIEAPLPDQGFVRAAATGRREPLCLTFARALVNGIDAFWGRRRKPAALMQILGDWDCELDKPNPEIRDRDILTLIPQLLKEAGTSILLVIDELGKNLEFATHHQGTGDLYLLQEIAELTVKGPHQVYFLGILHQSFAGYGDRLTAVEQNEWNKIQGRFEDIVFAESPNQMTRLIGQAIDRSQADPILYVLQQVSEAWVAALQAVLTEQAISASILAHAYPLHPLAALVLPMLCVRYAQNDRSLFTFLTSDEPLGFSEFLHQNFVVDDPIPTLKLHQIYDYFVESVSGFSARTNLQRWVEVQSLIQDARGQRPDVLQVLKTIGLLNLVTSSGSLRATPQLVALALCDSPTDKKAQRHWKKVIQELQDKGLITYRRQRDELKLWEGSDFDSESAVREQIERECLPLADLLSQVRSLKPIVAQRHYTTTGTLRYFERRYADSRTDLETLRCSVESFDGLMVYWFDRELPATIPAQTSDAKPFILLHTDQLDLLRIRAQEYHALETIWHNAPELDTDGVARKEVRHRRVEAERLLDETLEQAFEPGQALGQIWVAGEWRKIPHARAFQGMLSEVCDRTYPQSLILDNELINRRELTSQGAKARRELIEAMLERGTQERLGLQGYGPDVTMYYSVLEATGIHRQDEEVWGFYPPEIPPGPPWQGGSSEIPPGPPSEEGRVDVSSVWSAIHGFCQEATEKPRSLDHLYARLAAPPYGVKPGVVPVLLAAVLLYDTDQISLYKDGTFIPVLGPEHFELLVKDPGRFSVKYIELVGLRSQVFRELEAILTHGPAKARQGGRNRTVLSVVKPLVQFVRKLPAYTLKTKRLSAEAQGVLHTLQQTQEPDELLFSALPVACGFEPIRAGVADDEAIARQFREALVLRLREIHTAYDTLLAECETFLYNAFGLRSDRHQLRQDLQFRARYLLGNCLEPLLDRFVRAAVDETKGDRPWLEALVMIVADKPAESWQDSDADTFEIRLSELARRFMSREAMQKEIAASNRSGFDARRVTITRPDGSELNQMVWIEEEQRAYFKAQARELLKQSPSAQQRMGLAMALLETLLEDEAETAEQGSDAAIASG